MERWAIKLELTFDILDEDVTPKYEGDSEVDFSNRALARIRPQLKKLLNGGGFAHYHILQPPKKVEDD